MDTTVSGDNLRLNIRLVASKNSIAHNCYMFGTPIQIRIENEAMTISNRCILPDGWTAETLMENPTIPKHKTSR
jgi:hypothetical protein